MSASVPPEMNSDPMEIDKSGIVVEESQPYTETWYFAGPYPLSICFQFIVLNRVNPTCDAIPISKVIAILATSNPQLDDVIDELRKLAQENYLNLCVCVIDRNEKSYHLVHDTSEENQSQWPIAYLVLDRCNECFYAFYRRDIDGNYQTTFPTGDEHILQVFSDLTTTYRWPGHDLQGTVPSTTVQAADHLPNVINTLDLSHLLTNEVQQLLSHMRLTTSGLSYDNETSGFSLTPMDFSCPEATSNAIRSRLQLLYDLTYVLDNRPTASSTEITEATRTDHQTTLNNHEEAIRFESVFPSEQSLPLSEQSTVPPPITTDHYNERIRLPHPQLCNQPARRRHHRTFEDVRKHTCPAVQIEGASQGTEFEIKLPEQIKLYTREFYLGVRTTTFDKREHDQTLVIPLNASINETSKVKRNDLNCLIIPSDTSMGEFNRTTKGVFSKINKDEREKCLKKWSFKMVSFFQDERITKEMIKEKKLDWCRLMFAIYVKASDEQFERVSFPIYSDLIEDTNGPQAIRINTICPGELCQRGGQLVSINLGQQVKNKSDLRVQCNDRILPSSSFQLAKEILSFESPAGETKLRITVEKKDLSLAVSYHLRYRIHNDEHLNPCGEMIEQ